MSDNQNEINKMKAEIMYDEIIIKYDFIKDIDNEEKIIQKIIEFNFDENKIKEYYELRIYVELDDEYWVSGFIEEEYTKNKIKELHYNRKLIYEWIENVLIYGD